MNLKRLRTFLRQGKKDKFKLNKQELKDLVESTKILKREAKARGWFKEEDDNG